MRVVYIAPEDPKEKPKEKKLTKRQLFLQECAENLALRKFQDRLKANEMYTDWEAKIEAREAYLENLIKENNL